MSYYSQYEPALSPEEIAGIVVGVFVLIVVIPCICCCFCCGWCCFRGRKSPKQQPIQIVTAPQSQGVQPGIQINNNNVHQPYHSQSQHYHGQHGVQPQQNTFGTLPNNNSGPQIQGWNSQQQYLPQYSHPNYNAFQIPRQSSAADQRFVPLTEFGLQRNQSFQIQQNSRAPRNYLGQNNYDIYATGDQAMQQSNYPTNQFKSQQQNHY